MNKLEEGKAKTKFLSIRLTEAEYAKVNRTCHRDELKPSRVAYDALWKSINALVEKQEKFGYQCSQPL